MTTDCFKIWEACSLKTPVNTILLKFSEIGGKCVSKNIRKLKIEFSYTYRARHNWLQISANYLSIILKS